MRTQALSGLLVGLLAASACSEPTPTATLPVFDVAPSLGAVANDAANAVAHLAGANEVPARPTRARGTAVFHLSDDGTELSYKLIVANIENVVQSHIHVAPAGQNGPVVAFLFGPVPAAGGRVSGPIAEGTITAADFVGPLAGSTMADLVARILDGGAYVNVHTSDGVAPTNTGPGDFASGEVRGQIH